MMIRKLAIVAVVVWACVSSVMAFKYRSAAADIPTAIDADGTPALKAEVKKLRADHSRLTWELAAVKAKQVTDNSSRQATKRNDISQEKDANKLLSKDVWKGLGLSYKQAQDKEIGKKYGPLAKQLGMDPERRELFLSIMSERGGMRFMRLMDEGYADSNVLQKLLSADEYTSWQKYEKSIPVRDAVQAFESNTSTELTEDQRERLVDIFQKNDYVNSRSMDVSDDASASASIDRTYKALEPIMNEASAVLTPEQHQAMDKYFGEQVTQTEKMAELNSKASREARQATEKPAQEQGTVIRMPSGFKGQSVEVKMQNGSGFAVQGVNLSTINGAE